MKKGVLLLNLGTPDGPDPESVGRYLTEFLLDPLVIDIPAIIRWPLVKGWIVPKRSAASSALYRKIWTDQGSPLAVHHKALTEAVQQELGEGYRVQGAMRYGKPSIEVAVSMFRVAIVSEILVVPLYPQFSLAATQSSVDASMKQIRDTFIQLDANWVRPFYQHPGFLDAQEAVARKFLEGKKFDHYLFSFHGLPERQVRRTDSTKAHCLEEANCCEVSIPANRDCYRHQSFETAKAIAKRLALPAGSWDVCFQSRLGRTPWIRPYTDVLYEELPKKGKKRVAVFCPSFVADCLETLEEVQIRGKEQFLKAGGEDLALVPSLNSDPSWVRALAQIIREHDTDIPVEKSRSATDLHM